MLRRAASCGGRTSVSVCSIPNDDLKRPPLRRPGQSGRDAAAPQPRPSQPRPSQPRPSQPRPSQPIPSGGRLTDKQLKQFLDAAKTNLDSLVLHAPPQQDFQATRPLDEAGQPMYGQAGQPVEVLTNHFNTQLQPVQIYHFDVRIVSEAHKRKMEKRRAAGEVADEDSNTGKRTCAMVIHALAQQDRWGLCYAFDGKKNLYTTNPDMLSAYQEHLVQLTETRAGGKRQKTQGEKQQKMQGAQQKMQGGKQQKAKGGKLQKAQGAKQQPSQEGEQQEPAGGKPQQTTFYVTLQRVATLSTADILEWQRTGGRFPSEAAQALEVALKFAAVRYQRDAQAVGRAIYMLSARPKELGGGSVMYPGFSKALLPTQLGLTLNMDSLAGAFWEGANLAELFAKILGKRSAQDLDRQLAKTGLPPAQHRLLDRAIRSPNFKVQETHRGPDTPVRTAFSVTQESARTAKFESKDGMVTVEQYFADKYGKLRYPHLPLVNLCQGARKAWVPPELLVAQTGQRRNDKLSPKQQAQLVRYAAVEPSQRKGTIQEFINELVGNADVSAVLQQFGINLDPSLPTVPARVLTRPAVLYGGQQAVAPGPNGAWNLEGLKLLQPYPGAKGGGISWGVVCMVPEMEELGKFTSQLVKTANNMGLAMDRSPPIIVPHTERDSVAELLEKLVAACKRAGRSQPDIVFVIMKTGQEDVYKEAKLWSDTSASIPVRSGGTLRARGIATQCVNIDRCPAWGGTSRLPQYLANLLLKVNAKLGGGNSTVLGAPAIFPLLGSKRFMVVGVDVTHPVGVGQRAASPSVGAMCASLDPGLMNWSCATWAMAPRQEVVTELQPYVRQHLEEWRDRNRQLPDAIIVYRDGVSEGQMAQVFAFEFEQFKKAFYELSGGDTVPITYVIATKRHNTRFFPRPESPADADRSGNLPAGTVVDQGVTHPFAYDFFLQSHGGLKGTSKGVHYTVLVDQLGFAPDALQLVTYWQCYTFCRATRSVSIVPAVYYADLAAYRYKMFVDMQDAASSEDSEDASATSKFRVPAIHQKRRTAMFYV